MKMKMKMKMKMTVFTVMVFLFSAFNLFSQNPGGVTGARAWYRANSNVYNNAGTTLATNGNAVQQWNDRTANILHLSQATAGRKPVFRNGSLGILNYNPYLEFTNSDLFRTAPGLFISGTTYSQVAVYTVMIDDDVSNFDWYFYQGTNGFDRISWSYNFGGTNNGDIDLTTSNRLSYNHSNTFSANNRALLSYKANTNGIHNDGLNPKTNLFYNGSSLISANTFAGFVGTNNAFYLGDQESSAVDAQNSPFTGKIAEFILHLGNLTQTQHERINSYLAIKYGLTISHNYQLSNGTISYSVAGTYTNNIVGVALDNSSGLYQKQSHTQDDSTRIFMRDALATTNAGNGETIGVDLSSIMIGDDRGKMCAAAPTNNEKPAGIFSRINREWKIINNNFDVDDRYSFEIKLNPCAVTNSVNAGQIALLVDTDGDFTNASFYTDGSTGGSFAVLYNSTTAVLRIEDIGNDQIPRNSTRYITVGSTSSLTPLPVTWLSFDVEKTGNNKASQLTWKTASEQNCHYYVVERSIDAIHFESIGQVTSQSVNGYSSMQLNYEFIDTNPIFNEINYYRIKEIAYNETEDFTSIKALEFGLNENVKILPNPSNDYFQLFFTNTENSVPFEIFDSKGTLVLKQNIKHLEKIDVSKWAKGVYMFVCPQLNLSKKVQVY